MSTAKQGAMVLAFLTVAVLPVYAESIWPKGGGSLFADSKAYRVGDVVTVVVSESTSLSSSATTSLSKESETAGQIETLDVPKGSSKSKVFTGDMPKAKFGATRTFDGSGSYTMSGSIRTNLTAVVMEVLPNGNLVIEGSRALESVDEKVTIRVSGIVRPQDISAQNTVPSTSLAQGKIVVDNSGPIRRSNKRGFLNRIIDFLWPF